MVSGLAVLPKVSARNLDLKLNTVIDLKTTAAALVVNYAASYQSLSNSLMIDNQDAANAVTVRLNRSVNTITNLTIRSRCYKLEILLDGRITFSIF